MKTILYTIPTILITLFFGVQTASAQISPFTEITTHSLKSETGLVNATDWIDVEGDGDLDVFMSAFGQNKLYLNDGQNNFTPVTTGVLATDRGMSYDSTWGDYDQDGDLDVYVANWGGQNALYTNDGGANFTRVTTGDLVTDTSFSRVAQWVDYDGDGRLDLFVANGIGANSLYHNDNNGVFTKVTTGEIVTDNEKSMGAAWGDYDNDGDWDLYVTNFGTNSLYINNNTGTFTKVTTGDIVTDSFRSTSAVWGDYDGDQLKDLYVTNDSQQNNLYKNNGNGTFTKITTGQMVTDSELSRDADWVDVDNDGDLDLYVTNFGNTDSLYELFVNGGNGSFSKVGQGVIPNSFGRSIVTSWADITSDGAVDAVGAQSTSRGVTLFQNAGNSNSWLILDLGPEGVGAQVSVRAMINGTSVTRLYDLTGHDNTWLHIGMNGATQADGIQITWPDGRVYTESNVAVNQVYQIRQNQVPPTPPSFNSLAVSQSSIQANNNEIQEVTLVVNAQNIANLDGAGMIVNRERGVSQGPEHLRGRFLWNPQNGFIEAGGNYFGNHHVTLIPQDATNSPAGSQYLPDPTAGTVTFIFRYTAGPSYGDVADNDVTYWFEDSSFPYTSTLPAEINTSFAVTASGIVSLTVDKPILNADTRDLQTITLTINDPNPADIDFAAIIINRDPVDPSNMRGLMRWNGTVFEEGPNYFGSNHINLRPFDPNNRSITSNHYVDTVNNTATFIFRFTANGSYGNVIDNDVWYQYGNSQTNVYSAIIEVDTSFEVTSAGMPILNNLTVSQPTIQAGNPADIQEITMVIDAPDTSVVDYISAMVNRDSAVPTNMRGLFRWNPTNGFTEGPTYFGTQHVNLLTTGPNASTVTVGTNQITAVFRYTTNASYGAVADNDVWYQFGDSTTNTYSELGQVDTSFVVNL